jgi:hypothetical protein
MLSWRLWHALNQRPPKHPLRRLVPVGRSRRNREQLMLVALALFGFPASCCLCAWLGAVPRGAPTALGLLPYSLPLAIDGFLLQWATNIGEVIGTPQTRGLLPLLAVTPDGATGTVWFLARIWLHRSKRIERLNRNVLGLSIAGALLLILIVAVVLNYDLKTPSVYQQNILMNDVAFAISAFGFLALVVVDFIQTCVFAVVAGIMDTVYKTHHVDARVAAALLFGVVEALLYLLMMLCSYIALPNLYATLGINAIIAALMTLAAQFALLIGGRELVITALWRRLSLAGGNPLAETTT